jgi:DNA ligase (NAD+)
LAGADVGAAKTAKADKLGVAIIRQDVLWEWLAEAGVA